MTMGGWDMARLATMRVQRVGWVRLGSDGTQEWRIKSEEWWWDREGVGCLGAVVTVSPS